MGVEFRVLGPFEAVSDGVALGLGGPKQRALLAGLVLRANQVVSTDTLIDTLWGDGAPRSALGLVRTYVYRLRETLSGAGDARVTTKAPGYVLETDPDRVDAHRFETLVRRARQDIDAGRAAAGSALLDQALGLWRGDALADLADLQSLQPVVSRLEEMRLVALEDRVDAELALGHHAKIVSELEALTRQHPLRERFWGQLIIALYRSGRQSDALSAYQAVRSILVEQVGVEPSPELRTLEQQVLGQADYLRWQPPESRRDEPESDPTQRPRQPPPPPPPVPLQPAIGDSSQTQPLVGRSKERALIAQDLEMTRAGRFGVSFVAGPPGIGKTALVAASARDAHAAGAAVLLGRADDGASAPFQLFSEAIGHWATHVDGDALDLLGVEDTAQLARIAPVLGERRPSSSPSSSLDSGPGRQRLFEAIVRWTEVLTERRPAVIVLEDLQWADPASLLAVRHLLRHPPAAAALLVATFRDTGIDGDQDLARLLASTAGEPRVHRIELTGLLDDDVADLLRLASGLDLDDAGYRFASELNQTTGGNPLFTVEILRHLTERGAIAPDLGRWPSEPIDVLGVPSAVTELISRRLEHLPSPTSIVVRSAAVLGQHFDLPVLSRIVNLAETAVLDALEPAVAAELITEDRGRGDSLAFSHSLVRRAILDGLPLAEQARTHWRAGEVIAVLSQSDPEPRLGDVAHHLTAGVAAGNPHTAIAANVHAGQHALSTLAFEDARTRFITATELLGTAGVVDHALAYAAWFGLGLASGSLAEVARQRDGYLRAAEIARQQHWPGRLARAAIGFGAYTTGGGGRDHHDEPVAVRLMDEALVALGDAPTVDRCLLLAVKAVHAVVREQCDQARDLADTVRQIARSLDDPTALAAAYTAHCWTSLGTSRPHELDETAQRAISVADCPEARIFVRHFVFPMLPVPALQRADRAEFEALRRDVAAQLATWGSVNAAAHLAAWDAALALCSGRFDDVERLAATATPGTADWSVWHNVVRLQASMAALERGPHTDIKARLAHRLRPRPEDSAGHAILASLHAQAGDHAEAARHIDTLRRHRPLDQLSWSAPLTLRHLAETAARIGDSRLATDLLPVLIPYSGQMLVPFTGITIEAAADRAIGQLLLTLGQHDQAIDKLAAGGTLEESFGARALTTHTAYWHARARLCRDAPGDHDTARQLIDQASSHAAQLGMTQLQHDLHTLSSVRPST